MTSVDKLSRSFDFLKIPTQLYDTELRKQDVKLIAKKDKILHLNLIYDNIIASNVRQAEEFTKMISLATEAYLVYLDDEDPDIYFVADECLNKTIKTLLDTNLIRLQYDLYRFIRKNGPEKSLKGALIRFAELSHLIKSHKCRMFVELLTKENILSKLAVRSEESIQSVLVGTMNKICSSFCWSMTDAEIKDLIKSFMFNLSNESSVNSYRRVSANCLSIICLFSRSPLKFYYYLHQELLNLILPLEDCKNIFTIWGVLTCFRFMIIHLAELDKCSSKSSKIIKMVSKENNDNPVNIFSLINLCEIYEICVHFLSSDDNRILNSSLECLQVLLKYLPFKFDIYLKQNGSFFQTEIKTSIKIIGHNNDETTPPSDYLIRLLCTKYLLNNNSPQSKLKPDSQIKVLIKAIALECCTSLLTLKPNLLFYNLFENNDLYVFDLIEYINHKDSKMRGNICLLIGQLINTVLTDLNIYYDDWLNKTVSDRFKSNELKAEQTYNLLRIEILIDNLIRLIKSENQEETSNMCKRYAVNALHICLPTMIQTKYASYSLNILINLIHLKHSTYNLVKCELVDLISSIDFKTVNYIESLLNGDRCLLKSLDENNKSFVVKQMQENIIENLFIYLLGSEDSKLRLDTARSLTRFILNMNFYDIQSINSSSTSNQKALLSMSESLVKTYGYANNTLSSSIIDNDYFNLNTLNLNKPQLNRNYSSTPLSSLSLFSSLPAFTKSNNIINNSFIQPFNSFIKYWPSTASVTNSINANINNVIEHNINYIVSILIKTIVQSVDRHQFIGCIESLDLIFQVYSPGIYYSDHEQLYDLLNLMTCYLRHPLVAFDLYVNDILMRLIGNLYCSYSWLSMKKLDKIIQQLNYIIVSTANTTNSTGSTQSVANSITTIQNLIEMLNNSLKNSIYQQSQAELSTGLSYSYPLVFNNLNLKQSTDKLFVHLMKMLCILSCVIDETSLPSNLTINLLAGSTAVNLINLTATSLPNTQSVQTETPKTTTKTKDNIPVNKTRSSSISQPAGGTVLDESSSTSSSSSSSLPKTASNIYIGNFQNSSIYLKMYETAKSSYNSYKKSANIGSYDKFVQLIKATLKLFAQLLESSLGVHEIGPHLDEILLYLKIIFTIEPSCSVKCVTLCLKCLFNLNLAGLMSEYIQQQLNNANNFNSTFQTSTFNDLNSNTGISMPHQTTGLSNNGNLSNTLSSSLTSLTSYSNQTLSMIPIQGYNKKEKSSILSTIVTNQLNNFTRYIYSQTLIFKSDNLILNPTIDLQQLNSQLATYSSLPVSSSSSNISNQSVTTVSKLSAFSGSFSIFNLIRSKTTKSNDGSITQQQNQLQQQKLKQQKTDHKTTTQYIKSFESIVIKSLRQYTFTTSTNLQTRILELLTQLIHLKVDYCLLDSDKVFLEYVLKQFEYLEQKRNLDDENISNLTKSDINSNFDADENSANLLAKSYAVDLYENFDSETSLTDPLNPFDLDTMINKLCASLNSPLSSTFGAGGLSKPIIGSASSFNSTALSGSPIISSINLKQQEHQRNHILIPKLFDFLILLSHEKKTSFKQNQQQPPSPLKSSLKSQNGLLTISEVMQLCDNLIASENSPHTHAIPALRPLVMDLFLNRTNEDTKELDLQQDVLVKSMLRLIQYPQIWSLLTIAVLKYKRDAQNDNQDKWKKVSRHICDAIFDSMRSNLNQFKLRFREFNGNETRAIRRYSRSYVSWIESLKQMYTLLNCLAPQVYRPIDFILLSLFEISKPYLKSKILTTNEINNWLCTIMVHLYLLLTHSNEEQILIRMHHLMPEIKNSYNKNNNNNGLIIPNDTQRQRNLSSNSSIDTTTRSTTRSASPVTSSASSELSEQNNDELSELNNKKHKLKQHKSNYLNYKSSSDFDSDLNEAANYFSKFLLKIIEKCFMHLNSLLKFNATNSFSLNLSSFSTSNLIRDYQINENRDLNHTQHLLSNYLLYLMYFVNIGSYNKISTAISNLISNKSKEEDDKKKEDCESKNEVKKDTSLSSSSSSLCSLTNENDFNFESAQFAFKINRVILFKISKSNPHIASMWQYFLVLCNYQDTEYWSSSIENINDYKSFSSKLSSPNDLIDPNLTLNDLDKNDLKSKIKSRLNYSQKHNNDSFKKLRIENFDDNKLIFPLKNNYVYHSTLNEQLFKYSSICIYCENITTRNQLDNTTGLAMLLINSLIELFELASHESIVLDLFSAIHRNAYASSLFINCINSNWSALIAKRKLYLLHSCLKSVEGIHLSASGHLLNLIIDKYFNLPYLSLVKYADYIVCQRIEMMLSLSTNDLLIQLSEEQIINLNKYFLDFKYSFRHKRLISLLEQLQSSLNETLTFSQNDSVESPIKNENSFAYNNIKPSPSIDFFLLYINNNKNEQTLVNLDKEWYYNIVRSACCNSSVNVISNNNQKSLNDDFNNPLVDNTLLKSKQCALILSNLDYQNLMSILSANDFKLTILKDCILLGAKRTQSAIQKLPSVLKKAATNMNIQKDFMHHLWLASINLLFNILNDFCSILPKFAVNSSVYELRLNEINDQYDFDTYISPITEAINAYLKCVRQYPSLLNQLDKIENLISFMLFQFNFVSYFSLKKDRILTLHNLNESLLCLFNLLIDTKLLNAFCQQTAYSSLVSCIINDIYNILMIYFYNPIDENLIHTPKLSQSNIDYQNFQNQDLLFTTNTFNILLKLRFIISNHRLTSNSSQTSNNSENDLNKQLKSMNSTFSVSSSTHRFLQQQYLRDKIPFNMRDIIEKIYLNICRLPIIDRFIRIPDSLWFTFGFQLDYNQLLSTDTSTLPPLDYLKDPLILKEHLRHILCVGWTSRTQFEYEYVNLLTLLHNLSDENYDEKRTEGLPIEEIKERNKCICLVVKGLSSWLVKSTLTPKSGSSLNSLYEQVSRNKVPQFLHTQLGRQYSNVKRMIESFSRNSLYTKMNSISIANNINLLHMLDPILIDETQASFRPTLDFTQPQPTGDALANLVQTSMNLNEHNIMFSTNIERTMIVNLASNSDTYFYFTQISLEGYLKFLGLWNRNNQIKPNQITAASLAASITNFVTGNNIDEVVAAAKTTNALNSIIKVAEFFAEDTDLVSNKNINETEKLSQIPQIQSQLIQRSFNRNNLDLTSVLRTVLDYYESFFRQPCPQLKLEIFKSMIYLSNSLFDSKQQYESLVNKLNINFEWLNSFIQQDYDDQMLMPIVNELIDDSVLAAGIYAESLCRCCLHTSKNDLQMSSKDFERLNKMFENGFRSNSLAIKIATTHGIIYWLEAIALGFIANNDAKQITDHICKQISILKDTLLLNHRFISTLWSAVFYAIENCLDSIRDAQSFVSLFIKQTYTILNDPNTPYFLFYQLYMGLERFILSSMIPSFEINSIQRLLTTKFHDENKSLCLTSLTITSLYASNQSKHVNYWNDIINQNNSRVGEENNINNNNKNNDSLQNSPIHQDNPIENIRLDYPQILELTSYPELQTQLLKVLEVATNFLDRMKLSSTAKEASIYASLLPKILCDFLPPHDLLNKLITEFLNSSQHPYPEAVAYVLYKCFDLLQEKGLQSQIQEWCLLSLTNFLQRTSIYESIWLSSCLLVSATRNSWLKSTFPFLLNRYCSFETIDRAIFYMSVIEFRKQFTDKSQLQTIYSTFESLAKPNTPYADLIRILNPNEEH